MSLLTQMGGSTSTAPSSSSSMPSSSTAPAPSQRRPISTGMRRQSALLMEQLTRELDSGKSVRRRSSADDAPYERVSSLLGMLDSMPHLGATGRNGSMTLSSLSQQTGLKRRSRRLSGQTATLLHELGFGNGGLAGSARSSMSEGGLRRDSLAMFADLMTDTTSQPTDARRSSLLSAFGALDGVHTPRGLRGSSSLSSSANASAMDAAAASSASSASSTSAFSRKRKATNHGGSSGANRGPKKKVACTSKTNGVKRASNRSFEARRRNRVNNAMKQLKIICLRATKEKTATKIEVLEMAIGLLAKLHNEKCMSFQRAYDQADASGLGKGLTAKATQSGAADIRRSIRERKRRMRVNILETELSRLALRTADHVTRAGASKCQILERACAALGDPVDPMSDEEEGEQ